MPPLYHIWWLEWDFTLIFLPLTDWFGSSGTRNQLFAGILQSLVNHLSKLVHKTESIFQVFLKKVVPEWFSLDTQDLCIRKCQCGSSIAVWLNQ
jgi:hypothetical protein